MTYIVTQQQKIAVIGAGLSGVCTAYFLARAGHEVALIEQYGNVAEQASLGDSGLLAAASLTPWAAPGLRKRVFSAMLRPDSPLLLSASASPALWRWLRRAFTQSQLERFRINKLRLLTVAEYGQQLLFQMQNEHQIDYRANAGLLQLFRTEKQLADATRLQAALYDHDLAANNSGQALESATAAEIAYAPAGSPLSYSVLDAMQIREAEPNLHTATPLAGGWRFTQDGAGNALFFIKQMKAILQAMGVQCHFMQTVRTVHPNTRGVELVIDTMPDAAAESATAPAQQRMAFDSVVVAAGSGSDALLRPLGVRIPLHTVDSFSAIANIRNPEFAPHCAVFDDAYKTAVVRLDERIRITGPLSLQAGNAAHRRQAIDLLLKVAGDWYPDVANFNQAHFWSGSVARLPDGVPLIGATAGANVYVNLDGGDGGWAGTIGAAAALSDLMSSRQPAIDVAGLQMTRFA